VLGPELLHAQSRQQFEQMASPRRIAFRVDFPYIDGNPELPGDDIENRSVRPFVTRQYSSRKPEIAHQHRNAEPIVVPTMLAGKGQISLRQRVQPNKLALVRRKGEQFKALCTGQQLAAGHSTPTLPDRPHFFTEPKVVGVAMRLPDQSRNGDHIVRDGVIHVPKVNWIPTLVLFGVVPRKQEVGHTARLAGISFRNLE